MTRVALVAVLLTSLSGLARAEEGKPAASRFGASLRQWFLHVKEGLTESSVSGQRQKGRVTAVAAVRGSDQGDVDPSKPVWKSAAAGKRSKALKVQRQELAAVVDAALAGEMEKAQQKLDAFESAHSDSPLLADAREIRGKLKEAAGETSAAEEDMAKAKTPR